MRQKNLWLFWKNTMVEKLPKRLFPWGGISSDIVAFYGVGDVKYSYSDIESIEYEDSTFLPIAFDSFGNQIVISLHDGSISFVDHEKSNSVIRVCSHKTASTTITK